MSLVFPPTLAFFPFLVLYDNNENDTLSINCYGRTSACGMVQPMGEVALISHGSMFLVPSLISICNCILQRC